MDLYSRLKNLDIDRVDIDEKIALSAFAGTLTSEYARYGAEPPDWLEQRSKELSRDIKASLSAIIEKRLRDLRNRKAALLPREAKLANLDADIAALEAKLHD